MTRFIVATTLLLLPAAANAVEVTSKRAAAIKDCTATAKRHPSGKYYDWDGGWAVQYGGCMHQHGEAP